VSRGARLLLLGPYVLLLMVFFTAPLLLMLAISFSRQSFGQLEWAFTPQHYIHFFTDAYYLGVLGDTSGWGRSPRWPPSSWDIPWPTTWP
jgi:ABC-type spermidine/putrescine transport system permease subunit I